MRIYTYIYDVHVGRCVAVCVRVYVYMSTCVCIYI